MKLSQRLQKIADLIPENCDIVADIGTDHGKLLLYVLQNGKTNKVIASDISKKSLSKAEKLLQDNGFMQYTAIISNGFEKYDFDKYKIDVAVVAGIGGLEIINILQNTITNKNISKIYRFILQPQNNEKILRNYLNENGYDIITDEVIKDGKHFYSIINCVKCNKKVRQLNDKQLEFGKTNLVKPNKDFVEYLDFLIAKSDKLLQINIINSKTLIKKRKKLLKLRKHIINHIKQ